MDLVVAGSNPVTHPICTRFANQRPSDPQEGIAEGEELSDGRPLEFAPSEMLEYLGYIHLHATIRPRTYWCEYPFYTIIQSAKQYFSLGHRPEDLAHIETIEQKAWKKHQSHLNRLEQFPLEKAEYYQRLKEAHGINSVRGLSQITGEDWSYIAKILKTLALPQSIKDFLKIRKDDHAVIRFFHLRVLLDIARQGEERLQLARFKEFLDKFQESDLLGSIQTNMMNNENGMFLEV